MAHKKGGGSSRNGRDSNAQRLGVKVFGGQSVTAGPLSITGKTMAPAVRGHNSVVVFALP